MTSTRLPNARRDKKRSARSARTSGRSKLSGSGPSKFSRAQPASAQAFAPPLASVRWLLAALVGLCCLALACVYGTVCLLYWQGQWQFAFPPAAAAASRPSGQPADWAASLTAPHEEITFDSTETGALLLHGWWIPAAAGARYSSRVILFLHGGAAPLADFSGQLQTLHQLGINVFAFDYRGFGESAHLHPSERSVAADTDAAWSYLTDSRHIPPASIIVYGQRLGATVAAEAALRHSPCAGLILEAPLPPLLDRIQRNRFSRLLPLRLLIRDRFDPTAALERLAVPKLFLAAGAGHAPAPPLYYRLAAEPKSEVTFALPASPSAASGGAPAAPHIQVLDHRVAGPASDDALYRDPGYAVALNRFLGEYLPPKSK